jgi:hypothetical protein
MAAPIVLKILITGICAIVPSAKDKDLTRIIAPNAMKASMTNHEIPDHFAFVAVSTKNFRQVNRRPDFRFHDDKMPNVGEKEDQLIFIIQSEQIALKTAPTNTKRIRNVLQPKCPTAPHPDRMHPQTDESESTFYDLKLGQVCPKCGPLKKELFDVFKHPDLVALRMDLRGGRETTDKTKFTKVWEFKGSAVKKPLAQDAVFEFDVPANVERLNFKRAGDEHETSIELFSPDGKPIEVTIGNEPLRDILLLDSKVPSEQPSFHVHFPLIYAMYQNKPKNAPLPQLVPDKVSQQCTTSAAGAVRGPGDDCIPPSPEPQDPTP